MAHVQRSALLPFPVTHLFELVSDIERYPEFLPWCSKAALVEREAAETLAALTVRKGGIEHTFTTRNTAVYPERIDMQLVDGPFERLVGSWHFTDLQSAGTVGCKVELDLQFEFSRRMFSGMFKSLFAGATNSLVDAFCVRAGELYDDGSGA